MARKYALAAKESWDSADQVAALVRAAEDARAKEADSTSSAQKKARVRSKKTLPKSKQSFTSSRSSSSESIDSSSSKSSDTRSSGKPFVQDEWTPSNKWPLGRNVRSSASVTLPKRASIQKKSEPELTIKGKKLTPQPRPKSSSAEAQRKTRSH